MAPKKAPARFAAPVASNSRLGLIGGSACPRAITQKFQDIYGVEVIHAWGMTEMSPLGSLGSIKPEYAKLGSEERLEYTLVGDTVNLSQRLQQLAAAGETVISEATARALKASVGALRSASASVCFHSLSSRPRPPIATRRSTPRASSWTI